MLHVCAAVDALNAAPPSNVVDFQYIPPRAEGRNVMLPCVKIVRYYSGLGLAEAYELCKDARSRVPQRVCLIRGDAQAMIAELEEFGAQAEAVKETR
jgi:ribosomal protein L7/L12